MSTNPLVRLAEIYEHLDDASKSGSPSYNNLQTRCRRSLGAGDLESVSSAAARVAYEGQISLEVFAADHPQVMQTLDAKHTLSIMWNSVLWMRSVESNDPDLSIDSSHPQLLRMAASMMAMGTSLAPDQAEPDFGWLRILLGEIENELVDSSIKKELKLSIRRQISQTLLVLDSEPVSADLVIRYLAMLSGLLSAAAQSEAKMSKARRLMSWSVRIASGIVIDGLVGVPAASLTNAILMAIEPGSDDGDIADDISMGEAPTA